MASLLAVNAMPEVLIFFFSVVLIVWVLDQNHNATYLIYFFLQVISLKKFLFFADFFCFYFCFFNPLFKKTGIGTGGLLSKSEDPGLVPRTPVKGWMLC